MKWFALTLLLAALAVGGCGEAEKKKLPEVSQNSSSLGRDCLIVGDEPKIADNFIGLTFDHAKKLAESKKYTLRAVYINGEAQTVSEEFNKRRINVAQVNGVVTEFCQVG